MRLASRFGRYNFKQFLRQIKRAGLDIRAIC